MRPHMSITGLDVIRQLDGDGWRFISPLAAAFDRQAYGVGVRYTALERFPDRGVELGGAIVIEQPQQLGGDGTEIVTARGRALQQSTPKSKRSYRLRQRRWGRDRESGRVPFFLRLRMAVAPTYRTSAASLHTSHTTGGRIRRPELAPSSMQTQRAAPAVAVHDHSIADVDAVTESAFFECSIDIRSSRPPAEERQGVVGAKSSR
jgi:hypothetical protein